MSVQLFAMPGFASAVAEAPGLDRRDCTIGRSASGELRIELDADACDRDCVLVGSITPPDEQLMSFALAADTLDRDGARSVTAVLPYLAYARQGSDGPRRSAAAGWTGWLLEASGVDRVITVDVHDSAIAGEWPLPLESLSPAGVFAGEIARRALDDFVIVAPDESASRRARLLATALGGDRPVMTLHKRRTGSDVVHLCPGAVPAPRAVIVDDVLDTGATLVSACRALKDAGVRETTVFATHGLFAGDAWWALGDGLCDRLYVTDTSPSAKLPEGVHVLGVGDLLADRLSEGAVGREPAAQRTIDATPLGLPRRTQALHR